MLLLFFVFLLFTCLMGFLGLEYFSNFDVRILDVPVVATITSTGISPDALKAFFGIGVVFAEFVVVILAMLDRIGETLRDTVKPLVRLVPFGIFLGAIWNAFSPIAFNLLPDEISSAFNATNTEVSITAAVQSSAFTESILLSLGAMLLFIIAHNALGIQRESDEMQKLRAENAKLRKELRRGL